MHEFYIALHSVKDVQDFVTLANVQPFDVNVSCGNIFVSGKSLMGMFCLGQSAPLKVSVECSDQAYQKFYNAADPFLA